MGTREESVMAKPVRKYYGAKQESKGLIPQDWLTTSIQKYGKRWMQNIRNALDEMLYLPTTLYM